jgi:hypothetical protein
MVATEAYCNTCREIRSVTSAHRSGIVIPPNPFAWVVCHELECGHRIHSLEGAERYGRIPVEAVRECACP